MRPVAGRDVGERVVTTARCGQAVVEAVRYGLNILYKNVG